MSIHISVHLLTGHPNVARKSLDCLNIIVVIPTADINPTMVLTTTSNVTSNNQTFGIVRKKTSTRQQSEKRIE